MDARPTESPRAPSWVRVIELCTRIMVGFAAIACALLMLHVVVDVSGRTFFRHPFHGTLDITSEWWMVAAVFLALGYAQLERDHIRATVLVDTLPESWRRAADAAAVVAMAALAALMAIYGWNAATDSYAIREAATNARSIPIWPAAFLVPVGCAGLALQCVASLYRIVAQDDQRHDAEGYV